MRLKSNLRRTVDLAPRHTRSARLVVKRKSRLSRVRMTCWMVKLWLLEMALVSPELFNVEMCIWPGQNCLLVFFSMEHRSYEGGHEST